MNHLNKKTIPVVIVLCFLLGYGVWLILPTRVNAPVEEGKKNTLLDAQNVTLIIDNQPVTLVNGEAGRVIDVNTTTKAVIKYFGNEVRGDFNYDGLEDVAFLLTNENSGSGTFFYVAAILGGATPDIGTNAILLGDRISPQTTEFREGMIVVNFADRAPDEPFTTQPSLGVSRYFKIANNNLESVEPVGLVYTNVEFGFTLNLTADWMNYTVSTNTIEYGKRVVLRHPRWTLSLAYEDIPILVYPIEKWDEWENNNFADYPTAAPIGPTERGRNNLYVLATAPRYNYDFSYGYENVENIIKTLVGTDIVQSSAKACTEEAKICPDGSAVGRVGPNCEFAECPSEESCVCPKGYYPENGACHPDCYKTVPQCLRPSIECIPAR